VSRSSALPWSCARTARIGVPPFGANHSVGARATGRRSEAGPLDPKCSGHPGISRSFALGRPPCGRSLSALAVQEGVVPSCGMRTGKPCQQ
jgi:hypothetical protein